MPTVSGIDTAVSVHRIAVWHNHGLIPVEIAHKVGHISLVQVHAALAYYHANQDEIDEDHAETEGIAEALEEARCISMALVVRVSSSVPPVAMQPGLQACAGLQSRCPYSAPKSSRTHFTPAADARCRGP
ncbi:MAG: hypothetical protein U0Q16_27840 [Bryobacteraceae bacterium]